MNFRFRAIDNKSPATAASTSDQPLQDDSLNEELWKQRIKEEITMREIVRRRMLEAEIRRELLVERELAIRRARGQTEGLLSFDNQFLVRFMDEGVNRILDPSSSTALLAVPGSNSSLNLKEEPKPEEDEMNKLITLERPDPGKFVGKRKAVGDQEAAAAMGGGGERDQRQTIISTPWIGSKKLAKEEFVCSMCNVKATGEISFNAHINGKKHKAKEGRRQVQQTTHKEPNQGEEDLIEKLDHPVKNIDKNPALEKNKRLKFRCEICNVGVPCMAVMVSHNNGRKHKARLLKLSQQCKSEDQKD
ncbi:uncharacterized protein LOC103487343 [Cucumis melo]|uniref:Uncharacterized protein LOC103487343 n=1 Tax=Cucumis melo TaxID=3656 RepID=A0A1S3B9S7_CUCME|nr:uncharacterized protein LOC103487343 [Cucumis melo]